MALFRIEQLKSKVMHWIFTHIPGMWKPTEASLLTYGVAASVQS
jgi:hypothetical protein